MVNKYTRIVRYYTILRSTSTELSIWLWVAQFIEVYNSERFVGSAAQYSVQKAMVYGFESELKRKLCAVSVCYIFRSTSSQHMEVFW